MTDETTATKYGLSKKTNITIAAIGAMATAQDHWQALAAIGALAALAVALQFVLDYRSSK